MIRNFSMRLKDKQREALEKISEREEESIGEIIRRMIDNGIRQYVNEKAEVKTKNTFEV